MEKDRALWYNQYVHHGVFRLCGGMASKPMMQPECRSETGVGCLKNARNII